MADSAEPGWYHAEGDPPDTERYWDGFAWTEGPRPIGGTPDLGARTEAAPDVGTSNDVASDVASKIEPAPDFDVPSSDTPTEISFEPQAPGASDAPPTNMPVMGGASGSSPATGLDAGFPSMDDPAPNIGSYGAGVAEIPGEAPGGFRSATPSPTTPPPGFPPAANMPAAGGGFGGSTFPGAPVGSPSVAFPEQSQATTALVLSVVGLFCCGLPALVGVGMGYTEKKAIDEGRRDPANNGQVVAGFVIGGLGILVWGLVAAFMLLGFLAF